MKSLKVFILLGIILASFEAFGQSRTALTVIEGEAGRALLNKVIESNPAARAFFAETLGIKVSELGTLDSVRQAQLISRLNAQGPDQVLLLTKTRDFIMPLPKEAADLDLTLANTPITVDIELGDMAQIKADAYIVPRFSSSTGHGIIGSEVARAGGQAGIDGYSTWIVKNGQPNFGFMFFAPSGGGNSNYIFNAASLGCDRRDEFRVISEIVSASFLMANSLGLKTIAIPSLGTEILGGQLTAEESARMIMRAIQAFFSRKQRENTVEKVTIVIYGDRAAYEAFVRIRDGFVIKPAADRLPLPPRSLNAASAAQPAAIQWGVHFILGSNNKRSFVEQQTQGFEQSGEWVRVGYGSEYVDYTQYIGRTVGGVIDWGRPDGKITVYKGELFEVKNGSPSYERPFLIGIVRNWDGHRVEVPLEPYDKIFFVHK